jgi:hypothetical protein
LLIYFIHSRAVDKTLHKIHDLKNEKVGKYKNFKTNIPYLHHRWMIYNSALNCLVEAFKIVKGPKCVPVKLNSYSLKLNLILIHIFNNLIWKLKIIFKTYNSLLPKYKYKRKKYSFLACCIVILFWNSSGETNCLIFSDSHSVL